MLPLVVSSFWRVVNNFGDVETQRRGFASTQIVDLTPLLIRFIRRASVKPNK